MDAPMRRGVPAEPFDAVWNGEKFRAFRRLLREHERLPLCERCPA